MNNVKELLEDEHLKTRKFWTQIDHPKAGTLPYAAAPYRLSETPAHPDRAPFLGEHNDVVYGELGYGKEDLVKMRAAGVI